MNKRINLNRWLASADHLPACLKDFHDQKDVFKSMHDSFRQTLGAEASEKKGLLNWVTGQIYVIDFFLVFMAAHGYTLQRSKKSFPFADLEETIDLFKQDEVAVLKEFLAKRKEAPS